MALSGASCNALQFWGACAGQIPFTVRLHRKAKFPGPTSRLVCKALPDPASGEEKAASNTGIGVHLE